ncbi:EAL domain-containing protein [Parasphingopyxis algicola]|uniref:EAL domain-containing protein n=1 Tax=Parasphingopyxis algicola TaxID=2026624 RepID=UPI0015A1495F|nr:EAL domain-containing protein [Parasphingopyxis algicola]QLC23951.1 EAL domain-containing protein [Parasphingopyxis algicola]
MRREFIDTLRETLARHAVLPKRIIIEITEDARLADFEGVLANIPKLETIGVGISIDDFGADMANFDRVSHIPFTELKVDKSIFWACAEQRLPMSMLTGILEFCRARRTKSVVEGIETPAHLAFAKLAGADYGQGLYWGRSMPPQFILPTWR